MKEWPRLARFDHTNMPRNMLRDQVRNAVETWLDQQHEQEYRLHVQDTEELRKQYEHLCACFLLLYRSMQEMHTVHVGHHARAQQLLAMQLHLHSAHRNILNQNSHDMQQRMTQLETRVEELATQIRTMMQMMIAFSGA